MATGFLNRVPAVRICPRAPFPIPGEYGLAGLRSSQARVRILGVALLSLVIVAALGLVVLLVTHPRNESAYLTYLKDCGGDGIHGAGIDILPPRDQLLAEGDRACQRLGEQPRALGHVDGNHVGAFAPRYDADRAGEPLPWGEEPPAVNRVAVAAWEHLCPDVWRVVGPVHLFQDHGD